MHLIVDGSMGEALGLEQLEDKVSELVKFLNMTPVAPMFTYGAHDGVTIIQIIAESHICVHTVGDFLHIDIFSC